jgi:hypothetical protein|tara:strand:- start:154 stop:528 length:375 start_codon:yes stop_codon:yes gene_type:complete
MSRLGSPNKNKKFLLARLQDMYGEQFHPIMKMAEAASKLDYIAEQEGDVAALTAALNGWGKIAEYTEPKLKAVEVRADDSTIVRVSRRRFDGTTDAVDGDIADLLLEDAVIAEIVEDDEDKEDE